MNVIPDFKNNGGDTSTKYTMIPGRTLVIGPSRSGKSYFSNAFKSAGLHVIDTDHDMDLIKWRNDATDRPVERPLKPDATWLLENHFIIKPNELREYLAAQSNIIMFAHCWNIMDITDQFDRVAYMSTPSIELERRLKIERHDHVGGGSPAEIIFHRQRHQERAEQAKKQGITFIDTTLSPEEFYNKLSQIEPISHDVA